MAQVRGFRHGSGKLMCKHGQAVLNPRACFSFDSTLELILPCLFYLLIVSLPNTAAAYEAVSDLTKKFQSTLDGLQRQYGFPGATAAYVLPDGTAGVAATGVADIEAGTPMTVKSRMLSASIGKTFVGATAVALAREGILDLDIPVSRWLGDRKWFTHLPNHDVITLRHLLTHSSGLPDHVHMESFANEVSRKWREKENAFPPEALIRLVLDLPPLFEAGKGWAYSDTGYILIGLVIEKTTGKRYYNEIKKRFVKPPGLSLTAPADRRFLSGLAAGYMAANNAFEFPPKNHYSRWRDGVASWYRMDWRWSGEQFT